MVKWHTSGIIKLIMIKPLNGTRIQLLNLPLISYCHFQRHRMHRLLHVVCVDFPLAHQENLSRYLDFEDDLCSAAKFEKITIGF